MPQFHKSVIAIALINDNVFELIEHLPYSPYLPPSDFHLFTKLKNPFLVTTLSQMMNDIIHAVDDFLNGHKKNFFKSGIQRPLNIAQNIAGKNV